MHFCDYSKKEKEPEARMMQSENRLTNSEDRLMRSEACLTQSEARLMRSEAHLTQSEDRLKAFLSLRSPYFTERSIKERRTDLILCKFKRKVITKLHSEIIL